MENKSNLLALEGGDNTINNTLLLGALGIPPLDAFQTFLDDKHQKKTAKDMYNAMRAMGDVYHEDDDGKLKEGCHPGTMRVIMTNNYGRKTNSDTLDLTAPLSMGDLRYHASRYGVPAAHKPTLEKMTRVDLVAFLEKCQSSGPLPSRDRSTQAATEEDETAAQLFGETVDQEEFEQNQVDDSDPMFLDHEAASTPTRSGRHSRHESAIQTGDRTSSRRSKSRSRSASKPPPSFKEEAISPPRSGRRSHRSPTLIPPRVKTESYSTDGAGDSQYEIDGYMITGVRVALGKMLEDVQRISQQLEVVQKSNYRVSPPWTPAPPTPAVRKTWLDSGVHLNILSDKEVMKEVCTAIGGIKF